MIKKYRIFFDKIYSLLFKKRIKYHDVSKFLNENDLFFDIGAHLGDKSKELIKNKINVVLVEPQPECLKVLRKLYLTNPLVTIVPMGLGKINEKTEDLEVLVAPQHKFNGCGLVISSEVIKSGVNIPRSVFFVHEDTSFMLMTQKILGNIPQYIIKNILLVHNRNHPNKRMYIEGERKDGTMNQKRRSNDWYVKANKMSEQNCYNIFNPNFKSFTWEDVWE